jgi:uncharacterized protein (TIGR01777 family)
MKVVIAGGAGSLGRRVADDFAQRDHEVVILTRSTRPDIVHRQVEWDGRTVGAWAAELEGAVLINLAGELVDRRPTKRNIELLRRSRVEPTRALAQAAEELATPLTLWVQMSTLAIYGDAGQGLVEEGDPVAEGPPQMAGVARPWEEAARGARADRQVVLRTGIVLDRGAPAFERLTHLTKLGLGGRISRGDQWVSWIHIVDFLAALRFVCEGPTIEGVVHLASPNPIQNREMMSTLRSALHRPWSPPTPKPLVRIGALLMGTDPALALAGRRCLPRRLLDAGFTFERPTFGDAVLDLTARDRASASTCASSESGCSGCPFWLVSWSHRSPSASALFRGSQRCS